MLLKQVFQFHQQKCGKSFTVTVNMPSDAVGYEGTLTVTYSNGKKESVHIADVNTKLESVGNFSKSFTAESEGSATVQVTGLILSNASNQKINSNSTISKSFTVKGEVTKPNLDNIPDVPLSGENTNTQKTNTKTNENVVKDNKKENKVENKTENKVENNTTKNEITNEIIEENEETITDPYQEIVNEIGILPEVGKNIFDYIAFWYMILALGFVITVIKLNK